MATIREAKADIFLRDTDSQSLFNNSGVLSFKYYHEWNDCYNPTTDDTVEIDGEVYNEETGAYEPNIPSGYSAVFNGKQSALWDNMVKCFPERIKEMYGYMRNRGLSYEGMLSKYKEFWKYWCENLYNADAFGYANTGNFAMAYGDKLQLMTYFFEKRQRYMDSKFQCGSSTDNAARMRFYGDGNGAALKYCQAIYANLQWGASNYSQQRNIKVGSYSYMPYGFTGADDATFIINDADLVTELSSYTKDSKGNYTIKGIEGLGNVKFDQQMILLKRLTKFVMDYTASTPNTKEDGGQFDMSSMTMLKQVIVRNVTNLKKTIVLSSDLLEEIDFTGTPIAGLSTPPTDMLTKLVLPSTIKELNLVGYTNLEAKNLSIAGYSNIETLDIEDCPNLDSYSICKACYDAGAKLSNTTIKDIDWNLDNVDVLMYLASKKATLQGKIVVVDSIKLTSAQVSSLRQAFGNITAENNSLYISYAQTAVKSVSIGGEKNISKAGKYQYSLTAIPSSGNNIDTVKWGISSNELAKINEDSGIVTVNKIGTSENDDKVVVSVEVTLLDGTVLTATKDVYLYPHQLALGDYLFNDGSALDELKSGVSPVGVCFYINPDNRKQGLFVALSDMSVNYREWGLQGTKNSDSSSSNTINGIELADNPSYDVYDLGSIDNITQTVSITDDNVRGGSDQDADGFRVWDNSYPNTPTTMGDIGFVTITSAIYNTEGLGSYLSEVGLEIGDKIGVGLLETLRIIHHRDIILSDSSMGGLTIPSTEAELTTAIKTFIADHSNLYQYQQYYYPAASYCHVYQPSVAPGLTLHDGIKAGHWHLPSVGELSRMAWHYQKTKSGDSKWGIFSKSLAANVLTIFSGVVTWSSTEYNQPTVYVVSVLNGGITTENKKGISYMAMPIRPVLTFTVEG